MSQDRLAKAFLSELEALEKFRISYSSLYPSAPLAHEDPDVRRLIEAMAMFTARTRIAGLAHLDRSFVRIFRQHFPFLLDPVPPMGMLRALPTRRYVDVTELPIGTGVHLVERATGPTNPRVFQMRTLGKLRLLPVTLESVSILRTRARTYRIVMHFAAPFPRNEAISELNLYVDYLKDLTSSVAVVYALKAHLRPQNPVSVVFDRQVDEDTQGQPCDIYFGMPQASRDELSRAEHPLLQARSFIHNPRQELFVNVCNIEAPRNWQYFALCFDLGDAWPPELHLTADAFDLHVVPMANLRADMANPIECDGTQERYSVRHPEHHARFALQRLLGVYAMTDSGLLPLDPGVVADGRDSYELHVDGQNEERRAWLSLNVKSAFESPLRIAVEAQWYQPGLLGLRGTDVSVRLADRHVDGVEWECSGPLIAPPEGSLAEDRGRLLELLSIKNQRFLGLEELLFVFDALGARRDPFFADIIRGLSDVKVVSKPFARQSHSVKHVYELTFDDLAETLLPRLDLFCGRLLHILAVWSVEEVVELVVRVRNLEKEVRYS